MKPRLGYVLVGSNKDSSLYVRLKKKACEEIGIDHIGKSNTHFFIK
jgi:5,10-methylene-tetrahydrofolate dehydrogenase/methenyl tetrahydrofolate cyclohydrolase